jgi:hypothetical protein
VDETRESIEVPGTARAVRRHWKRFEPGSEAVRVEADRPGWCRVTLGLPGEADAVRRAEARAELERFRVWVEAGAQGEPPTAADAAAHLSGSGMAGKLSGAGEDRGAEWRGPTPPEAGLQTAPDNLPGGRRRLDEPSES